MFEKIEQLIEEPEKRKKYLVFAIRTILSAILASFFYTTFISPYALLDVFSTAFWPEFYKFLISGRILLVVFLFLFSRILLFDLAAGLITTIIDTLLGWLQPNEQNFQHPGLARWLLIKFKAIRIQGNKIFKGKEFDSFYKIVKEYRKKAGKAEIEYFKNMLITQVMQIYYVFILVYYFILDLPDITFLNVLIITVGVILLVVYFFIHFFTQMLDATESMLYNSMRMLKADKVVEDFMHYHNIPAIHTGTKAASPYARFLCDAQDMIVLDYIAYDKPFNAKHIRSFSLSMQNKNWKHAILISTQKPDPSAAKVLKEHSGSITLVVYTSEKFLKKSLYVFFKEAIANESLTPAPIDFADFTIEDQALAESPSI